MTDKDSEMHSSKNPGAIEKEELRRRKLHRDWLKEFDGEWERGVPEEYILPIPAKFDFTG